MDFRIKKHKERVLPIPWSEAELKAAVDAYLEIQKCGNQVVKSVVYRDLAERFNRTPKAFEYRMQNISAVLVAMGLPWVEGLKPAKNVGSHQAAVIERLLRGARVPGSKTGQGQQELKQDADDAGLPRTPHGVEEPVVKRYQASTRLRSSSVREWVLAQASGICECCRTSAPFNVEGGAPYLEVHHMRPLAEGGSDKPSNTVALCPNCHRAIHMAVNYQEIRASLYAAVARLIHE